MAFPNREWLLVLILTILSLKGRGTYNYNPYGATPSSGCVSLINPNTQYSASSSSAGPGKPVLHGDDVWCAGIDDQFQFLTVNLGFNLLLDRISIQGKPGSSKAIAEAWVNISTDNVNYQTILEGSKPKPFYGPFGSGDGDIVMTADLPTPVSARYVRFLPREPVRQEEINICMRVDVQSCRNVPTPRHGQWTPWSSYTACTNKCFGTKSRFRSCSDPAPAFRGNSCNGHAREDIGCYDCNGPVNGNWSPWGSWSSCSTTCGDGQETRTRSCNDPPPVFGGANCTGPSSEARDCSNRVCGVDGGWSGWSQWSRCSKSCAGGRRVRSRTCSNPFPLHGGQTCKGKVRELGDCNTQHCPVDGGWGLWGAWSNCPVTCGGGSQLRNRSCNNPQPQHGGKDCNGNSSETQPCGTQPCPVNGNWSSWTTWSSCSEFCQRDRSRQCNSPAPDHGGADCSGFPREVEACNVGACQNGNWALWGAWTICSASCFPGGSRSRSRTCTSPPPSPGGQNCTGDSHMTEQCNNHTCPIDGGFTQWTTWTTCSVTCGGGTKVRERTCSNPPPSNGGKVCSGDRSQVQQCNAVPCPINGNWSQWTSWTQCTLTCENGTQYRTRVCDSPRPQHNGFNCSGPDMETRLCNPRACPVDGGWSSWIKSDCSVTCGQGKQSRTRTCTKPPPSNGGANCTGDPIEINLDCNSGPCPPPTGTPSPPITATPTPPDPNITKLDLVFALSATSSNKIETYVLMRNTINRFIDTYGVNKVHYGIIIYGEEVYRVINFNHTFPPSANEVKAEIDRQPPRPGPTVLRGSLQETLRMFTETMGRPKAKKVLVVITDSNSPTDNKDTLTAAVRPLENNKILVISVAIGKVNRTELRIISPNPLDVISVQPSINSGVLSERIMDRILRRDIPFVDIGFALSATTVDSSAIFTLMKNTIITIIERYGVDRVKFSVIVYGSVVTTQLGDFKRDFTQEDLIRAVNNTAPNPGPVNLDQALQQAVFIFNSKARPNAKRVFVVLTDNLASNNENSLIAETALLRREGVLVLSAGFGSQSNQIGQQMNSVVFAPVDYIGVPNYPTERPVVIAEAIMFKALQANVPLIDLTFALSATSVSFTTTFTLMKKTVQSIAQKYGVDRIHYGVIVFGSVATKHIDFAANLPNRDELVREVSQLPLEEGKPDLVLALQEAKRVFEMKEVRPNAKKVLVVILDNAYVGNRTDLNQVVQVLVNKNVLIIGVGVGPLINSTDLEIITEEIRNIITVGIGENPDVLAEKIMRIILRTSGFSQWTQWSPCSRTCRYLGVAGTRRRTRNCRIPELGCVGPYEEITECNTQDCQGCGERFPLNDSNYRASSNDEQPARFAALDTSNPKASQVSWCREVNDIGGYIEINLGETVRVYRVATKGQEEGGDFWVTNYYVSLSPDGQSFFNYSRGETEVFAGNKNPISVAFNELNESRAVQYVRFHPVSFQERPCMQASVFGCSEEVIGPTREPIVGGDDTGKGILIALWILAGILTFLLFMACCYYCCWHVCCGRGKKRGHLAYKGTSTEDGGYLIEEDKRWTLPQTIIPARVPEDEVQEVTIEMTEEKGKPLGVIQFGIETEETEEKHVTAEDVKSEKPAYSEDVGTIKSGSTMMTMSTTERRKRVKSEGAATAAAAEATELSYRGEQMQGSAFDNEAFMRSQEDFVQPPLRGSSTLRGSFRGRAQDFRRSLSADELATLDYDMFENHRGSTQAVKMGSDGYMRMQRADRGSMDRTDESFTMGTVDVAIAGVRTPNDSRDDSSHIYDMAEQEITFSTDNGGQTVYTLDNGGYRAEEWYKRGGGGPGQLREEGFKEIHVEHQPIYSEVTMDDEDFLSSRA